MKNVLRILLQNIKMMYKCTYENIYAVNEKKVSFLYTRMKALGTNDDIYLEN